MIRGRRFGGGSRTAPQLALIPLLANEHNLPDLAKKADAPEHIRCFLKSTKFLAGTEAWSTKIFALKFALKLTTKS
jgi:hypothetical protein